MVFRKGDPPNIVHLEYDLTPEKYEWQLQGNRDHGDTLEVRGIGLVDVLWKTVSGAINYRIGEAINYHGVLNELREGQGTRITPLEAKMIHQMTEIREEVLYGVFLDLRKACNVLVRELCHKILVTYGAGPWMERLICRYWYGLTTVAHTGRYYGAPLKGSRGSSKAKSCNPQY